MFQHQSIVKRRPLVSVPIEEDVIHSDVQGEGFKGRLRRWWYDLFLLSYEDNRSKHYYMSSYAMMMARNAQFHQERSSIHPFSKFRNFWDCLTLHLLLVRVTLFHLNTSIIHNPQIFFHYFLAFIDYVFIVDLYINAKTGYTIKRTRQVVMNSYDILLNYLSTYAGIDAFTAVPLQSLVFLKLGPEVDNPPAKANLFVCTLKIISLIHIVKLFQASEYWSRDRGSYGRTITFKFIRIVVVGIVVIFQILALTSTLSIIVSISTGMIKSDSYNGHMVYFKYQTLIGEKGNELLFVFMRFSRVCKSLFLFGYGVLPNTDVSDHISAILSYWVAFIFHLWAGIVLYSCVTGANSLEDRMYVARKQTFNVLRIRKLSDTIHDKVVDYFDYKMSSLSILEKKNCLLKVLPPVLTSEIKMISYRNYVEKIPSFSEWPTEVIGKIVELLQPIIYLDNDLVSSAQGSHEGLMILEAGLLAVYSAEKEIGHLADGDYFGEAALVMDRETLSNTVVAVTASVVLLLEKMQFRKMMTLYPDLFFSLRMATILATVNDIEEADTSPESYHSATEYAFE